MSGYSFFNYIINTNRDGWMKYIVHRKMEAFG